MIDLSQKGDTLSPVDKCSDSWGRSGLSIGTTTAFVVEPSVLQILGSDAGDFILLIPEGDDTVRVSTWLGSSSETRQTYDLTDVTRIEVSAGGGNDFVFVSRSIDLPILLQGGAGSDFLRGANHSNLLLGGAGNDLLVGGLGRDVLIGGADADLLMAYAGEDVLLGEVADNSVGQMLAAWESWIAPDDFPVREAAIRLIINPVADSAADFLFGGPDQDLLLTVESGEGEIAAAQAAEAGSTDLTIALRGMSGMAQVGSNPVDPRRQR